jgi:ABC-type lipoprotein export system ATPase subunit
MDITLKQLIPIPLKDRDLALSEIWDKDLLFESKNSYQIVANSGGGKTTLLHCLYGIRTDYTGSIEYNNQTIKSIKISDLRRNDISIVFQDLMLFQDLTGLENIQIKSTLTTSSKSIDWINQVALDLGVADQLNQKIAELSRGERQRIAIIRALSFDFKWLFLDEPFSHLDKTVTNKVITLINERLTELQAGLILVNIKKDDYFQYSKTHLL